MTYTIDSLLRPRSELERAESRLAADQKRVAEIKENRRRYDAEPESGVVFVLDSVGCVSYHCVHVSFLPTETSIGGVMSSGRPNIGAEWCLEGDKGRRITWLQLVESLTDGQTLHRAKLKPL